MRVRTLLICGLAAAGVMAGLSATATAMSLKEAIKITIESNPQIGEAIANREAREFELRQAHGLYLPQIDLEGRIGTQQLDSPATRSGTTREDGVIPSPASEDDDTFFNRKEVNVVVQQLLFDGFNRRAERERQASRVDSASHRVYGRSESIALNVVREYLEVGLRQRVVDFAQQNIDYHQNILADLEEGVAAEALSVADRQQAEERLLAAEARLIEAREELNSAKIRFFKLVGEPLEQYQGVPAVATSLPPNLDEAVGTARQNNPNILAAKADIDAAHAQVKQARSEFLPEISLEMTARAGDDLDAVRGTERELRAEVVARWNIFKGNIDSHNVQEQIRRADEQRHHLREEQRHVEEAVRLAWERRLQQSRRLARLQDQLASTDRLIESYREQFQVGDRSLLDLLDTQNTRFNTQVAVATADSALKLANYRVLASIGMLLNVMRIDAPEQAHPYARAQEGVPETPEGETFKRYEPKRGGWDAEVSSK
jgi:adhesin transport system outer membrane protein